MTALARRFFISSTFSEFHDVRRSLARGLRARGHAVWLPEEDAPGKAIPVDRVREEIEACTDFVCIVGTQPGSRFRPDPDGALKFIVEDELDQALVLADADAGPRIAVYVHADTLPATDADPAAEREPGLDANPVDDIEAEKREAHRKWCARAFPFHVLEGVSHAQRPVGFATFRDRHDVSTQVMRHVRRFDDRVVGALLSTPDHWYPRALSVSYRVSVSSAFAYLLLGLLWIAAQASTMTGDVAAWPLGEGVVQVLREGSRSLLVPVAIASGVLASLVWANAATDPRRNYGK